MQAEIKVHNSEELQKLLERAATLTKQLNETLQQINKLQLVIETKSN